MSLNNKCWGAFRLPLLPTQHHHLVYTSKISFSQIGPTHIKPVLYICLFYVKRMRPASQSSQKNMFGITFSNAVTKCDIVLARAVRLYCASAAVYIADSGILWHVYENYKNDVRHTAASTTTTTTRNQPHCNNTTQLLDDKHWMDINKSLLPVSQRVRPLPCQSQSQMYTYYPPNASNLKMFCFSQEIFTFLYLPSSIIHCVLVCGLQIQHNNIQNLLTTSYDRYAWHIWVVSRLKRCVCDICHGRILLFAF